jgi:small-conductance mechanosensitive channel
VLFCQGLLHLVGVGECHNANWQDIERIISFIMLSGIMLSVVMFTSYLALSSIMLSAIILRVVILNITMLGVIYPEGQLC